jgi:integrase/recombinase XerD
MPKPRTCLYPPDWPQRERLALEKGLRRGSLFTTGEAAHWTPDTVDRRVRSYGTFLFFSKSRGELIDGVRPAVRASGPLLEEFIEDLTARAAPVTIAITLAGIAAVVRIIDPEGDRTAVATAARYFARHAEPVRDIREILVGASQLYHAGIDRMRRVSDDAATDPRAAMIFQDGLMIAMTTAHPVRLKNLQSTRVAVHFRRTSSGPYRWRFDTWETKNHKKIEADMPASLTLFIDRWLDHVRPSLLRRQDHDGMWVTNHGDPMSRNTVYYRLCNATEEELGVRIYPHAIRHIAATSIAVSMPEKVRMTPFILYNDDRTAQQHYNVADQLSASCQYVQRLEVRRQQAMARLTVRR